MSRCAFVLPPIPTPPLPIPVPTVAAVLAILATLQPILTALRNVPPIAVCPLD